MTKEELEKMSAEDATQQEAPAEQLMSDLIVLPSPSVSRSAMLTSTSKTRKLVMLP